MVAVLHLPVRQRLDRRLRHSRGDRHIALADRGQESARHVRPLDRIVSDRGDATQVNLRTGEDQRQRKGVVDVLADVEVEQDRNLRILRPAN